MVSGVMNEKSTEEEKGEEGNLPSIEVAEARIAQALMKYKVRVSKQVEAEEQEKTRLRLIS